ncbi:bipolar kinesin KRP-130-like [Dorcoceras hygrometricum]|uniref:Bipolar kinesin KRP-130-like n=1 Tax=Dorcoceras hygrometricum TaxID=472368 RepID=A0A2Z7BFP2_9LAMI|nr:bipolar kinesin KRP-130-like [Dorcoceras hygrometricum]
MEMKSPPPCPPTVTIRRNPPRKARATPSSAAPLCELFPSPGPPRDIPSCPLRDILSEESIEIPEDTGNHDIRNSPKNLPENLKVYLRIRPMDIHRHGVQSKKNVTESKNAWPKNPKVKIDSRPKLTKSNEICVQINDDLRSVTVLTPQALQETKRIKSEAYEGFSHVFSSEASQTDVYKKMVKPLVEDFLHGKSGLLVAMGPTGSGKTHTVFGCAREPGMVPLALRRIFSKNEIDGIQSSRKFHLSMFEICSEKGKAERLVDLLHDGGELSMQQSVIRGLQEVVVCDAQQAELLIAQGMLKRSTAMTNSNSQSRFAIGPLRAVPIDILTNSCSRSQCIINIRCGCNKGKEDIAGRSVLSIVDLAGAEKEKKTGNQGARLLESNFINNTSMVFAQCLRLTRYLREYLEGKKRMMLILTVKPGIEDYLDTSFLLRQASPFTKIKFKSMVEPVNSTCNKRPNQAFPQAGQLKKMKTNSDDAYLVAEGIVHRNVPLITSGRTMKVVKDGLNKKLQEIDDANLTEIEVLDDGFVSKEVSGKSSSDKGCLIDKNDNNRSYKFLQEFSKALWNVLKHYKEKLKGVENESCHLRDRLTKEQARNLDLQNELTHERMKLSHLENELNQLKSHHMCHKQACTDHELPVSLNYAFSSPSKDETASSSEVIESSVTFASSVEGEERCHQQREVLSKSINDALDAMGLKDTGMVNISRTENPPLSTDNAQHDFKTIGTLDMCSISETHYTSHAEDATGFKDTSMADMYSKPKDFSVSAVDVEDCMINTDKSDICCTSETNTLLEHVCHSSSHECEQADGTICGAGEITSVLDVEDRMINTGTSDICCTSETPCLLESVCLNPSHECEQAGENICCTSETASLLESAVDVEDSTINTGISGICCTSETTSQLESVCLNSGHECEQADENFVGEANNLKPESEYVLHGYCLDTSLECDSKYIPQDYDKLRYAYRDQSQLESGKTAFSKAKPPKNGETCFPAEAAQFNNEKSKANPSIAVLPKEEVDGSNKLKTISKFAPCGNVQHLEKPKRRLLPASSVLLKDISRLEVSDEEDKPKGARGAKRTLMDDKNRTQGSISLRHYLQLILTEE